jgi:hypothetical protein
LIAPFLCGTDIASAVEDDQAPPSDQHRKLELYVHHITALCDLKIDEISTMIPKKEVETLRSDHYAWKLDRDVRCAATARSEAGELRELECLAELSEEYLDRRESEIAEIEARQESPAPAR